MAKQVRPWLMKPVNGRALTSARKQMGVSQQNPSGTAAFAPQQKSGCTGAIETCWPRHAKKSLARLGASMYGQTTVLRAAVQRTAVKLRAQPVSFNCLLGGAPGTRQGRRRQPRS